MARKTIERIRTAEQFRALSAPATFEVFEALHGGGPATAAELGPRLGRKANSLHYHVKKLLRLGLVVQVDARRSGARTEAVYDVTAEHFQGPTIQKNLRMRKATTDAVAAILRLANRNFANASDRPGTLRDTGAARNILAERKKAWLGKRELAEANKHLDALARIFADNHDNQRGALCALTMVLTPLDQDGHPSGRRSKGRRK